MSLPHLLKSKSRWSNDEPYKFEALRFGCWMVAFYSSRSLVNSLQVLYILNANWSLYSCCFYDLMDQCCCLYGSWGFNVRFSYKVLQVQFRCHVWSFLCKGFGFKMSDSYSLVIDIWIFCNMRLELQAWDLWNHTMNPCFCKLDILL
jgi:hypothetical protein